MEFGENFCSVKTELYLPFSCTVCQQSDFVNGAGAQLVLWIFDVAATKAAKTFLLALVSLQPLLGNARLILDIFSIENALQSRLLTLNG